MIANRRNRLVALTAVAGLALVGGCGADEKETLDPNSAECAPYTAYQGHDGETVSIYGSIRDAEQDSLNEAWDMFSQCTGIEIEYEGSGEFEAQLQVRVDGGNAPDLAFLPQPGLLETLVEAGKVKEAPAEVKTLAEQNWTKDWLGYGTVDGTFYAAPLGSNVKSFVWYSPGFFEEKGYKVPTTWDEMTALSDTIADSGIKPWCAGIESGDATGWPATDWIEDVLLRTADTDTYDKWVSHGIPFNDPKIVEAVDKAGSILKNDKYVNGGFGDVKSIASTAFQEGGQPILEAKCAMHRQASFYAAQWPDGTNVGPDGDVFAFYFPAIDASQGKPVLVGGELTAAFNDRGEVKAVQQYLASADFANSRAKLGSWVSANKGLKVENVPSPIDKLSVETLQDENAVIRFDGSDLMPAKVGAGTFWRGMTDWITGKDTQGTLDYIEDSWK
ncbi:MAG: carbohydrate ABC transporter substrate-binding protein [Dactylosporangium sp.]|nr:ABC transporter substrate-binding protein [Dactylosporangium sp.]NNJ60061.1 carbohydrate ABC transporter substrate-binding protein [Dactylosporangium sp.]